MIQTLFLECEASKAVFDLFTNAGIPYVPGGQGALPAGSSDLEFDVTIHGHEMLVQKAKHAASNLYARYPGLYDKLQAYM